jgi:hypothetical protein
MEQSTLKYLRIVVPGLIILVGIYPIYDFYFPNTFRIDTIEFSYLISLSIVAGSIYYQLNFQRILTYPSHYLIRRNILQKLVKISTLQLSENKTEKLWKKDRFMHVFYKLIDNDESLKRKGANVYFNGIFWTSTADSFLINLCFYIVYKLFYFDLPKSAELTTLLGLLCLLSLALHIISVIKHIKLSNDQLDYIKTHNSLDVKNKLNEIL